MNHRFGHPQFVDPVPQGDGVLLDGEVLPLDDQRLGGFHPESRQAVDRRAVDVDAGRAAEDGCACLRVEHADDFLRVVHPLLILDADADDTALEVDAAVADILFPQPRAQVRLIGLHELVEGGVQVDLVEEVDAAAQVEPQAHGFETEEPQPAGRPGSQRQGDDVKRHGLAKDFAAAQLGRHFGEAHDHRLVFEGRG